MKKNALIIYTSKLPSNSSMNTIVLNLEKYMGAAENLVAQADRAEITDADSYAKGGDLISIGRAQSKKAEDERTKLVGPFNKLVKYINSAFRLPKDRFTDSRTIVEKKMMEWKSAEDEKLRAKAREANKLIEAEAQRLAALEKSEEDQTEILEQAAAAKKELITEADVGLQRGEYGSSTGTRKTYSVDVENIEAFVIALVLHVEDGNKRDIELGELITFKTRDMNKFAERMYKAGVRRMPGAVFTSSENIRVY